MGEETNHKAEQNTVRVNKYYHGPSGGAFYGLGFIGAAVYYIQQADGFWWGVVAFLKAIVWPAFFVYDLLKFIH